jgi:hypothetical protein
MIRDLETIIINFLKLHKGIAYTPNSLLKRVKKDIQNSDMFDYLQKNIEGVLNKLAFSYLIDMHEHEGIKYYLMFNE